MSTKVTLIPGDGIGPEITEAAVRILRAAGADIAWERHDAGHGSAPDIAGKGMANPLAVTFSGIMMLRRMGQDAIADRIKNAAFAILERGEVCTPDLGGTASTMGFADAIVREMAN